HFLERTLRQGKNDSSCAHKLDLILFLDGKSNKRIIPSFYAHYPRTFRDFQTRRFVTVLMLPQDLQQVPDYPAHPSAYASKRTRASNCPEPEDNPLGGIQIFVNKMIVTSPIPDLDHCIMAQDIAEDVP